MAIYSKANALEIISKGDNVKDCRNSHDGNIINCGRQSHYSIRDAWFHMNGDALMHADSSNLIMRVLMLEMRYTNAKQDLRPSQVGMGPSGVRHLNLKTDRRQNKRPKTV